MFLIKNILKSTNDKMRKLELDEQESISKSSFWNKAFIYFGNLDNSKQISKELKQNVIRNFVMQIVAAAFIGVMFGLIKILFFNEDKYQGVVYDVQNQ